MVNNIIREYRNYIHLQGYENRINTIGPLTEVDYNLLFQAFSTIIEFF